MAIRNTTTLAPGIPRLYCEDGPSFDAGIKSRNKTSSLQETLPLKDHEIAHVWGIPLGSLAARKVKSLDSNSSPSLQEASRYILRPLNENDPTLGSLARDI